MHAVREHDLHVHAIKRFAFQTFPNRVKCYHLRDSATKTNTIKQRIRLQCMKYVFDLSPDSFAVSS